MYTVSEIRKEYEAISLEAFNNPFSTLNFKLKQSFQKIVSHFNDVINHKKTEEKEPEKMHLAKQIANDEKRIRTIGFIPFKDLNVPVPPGFKGNILTMSKDLDKVINQFKDLEKTTLKPTHNLILKYIGKPQLLSSITNNDFKDIKIYKDEMESTKKNLNLMFDYKHNYQKQKFSSLFKNMGELTTFANLVYGSHYSTLQKARLARPKLVDLTKEISKSMDLLMLRMEQKPDQYAINAVNAEKISSLLLSVAEVVEFHGSMQVLMDQTISTGLEIFDLVNLYISGNDEDWKEFTKQNKK